MTSPPPSVSPPGYDACVSLAVRETGVWISHMPRGEKASQFHRPFARRDFKTTTSSDPSPAPYGQESTVAPGGRVGNRPHVTPCLRCQNRLTELLSLCFFLEQNPAKSPLLHNSRRKDHGKRKPLSWTPTLCPRASLSVCGLWSLAVLRGQGRGPLLALAS